MHGLTNERVIMHAGNHSPVHPLDTLVEAISMTSGGNMRYFFVGGGVAKARIDSWVKSENPRNVNVLPYQPIEHVDAMLSAADVHVVTVGNNSVGTVHPSKIYGALAAGRPVLVFGPRHCPAAKLVHRFEVGWHIEHGDVLGASAVLRTISELKEEALNSLKERALQVSIGYFSRNRGIQQFCDRLLA